MEDHANFCDGKKEIVTERKDKQENKRLHSQLDTHTLSPDTPRRPAVSANPSLSRLPLLCTICEGNEMPCIQLYLPALGLLTVSRHWGIQAPAFSLGAPSFLSSIAHTSLGKQFLF